MSEPPPAAEAPLPDPALVVLVGASSSGKSTWAAGRYRRQEIVSADDLRGVVGSGPHDLDASTEAFVLLDQIVAGRLRRRLTTVVDTLGFDTDRRGAQVAAARATGLPCIAVVMDAPAELCRQRNAARDRPIPATVLTAQLRRQRQVTTALVHEGWDRVVTVPGIAEATAAAPGASLPAVPTRRDDMDRRLALVLHVSRFPWGDDPAGWLRDIALSAADAGFAGLSLMDHLIQIPQVGRAWDPIPEPWVALGLLAGLGTALSLGTLVTPITMRPAGMIAKAVATLDVVSGGRAFCGIGAGWWEREHAAFGLPFPSPGARLDVLERSIETIRALWASGTKAYDGDLVTLPETTCYPRPISDIPIIVGGGGERRTLRIAARLGDGCNLPSDLPTLERKLDVLRAHCDALGREFDELAVTVLDLPVIGRDRDDVWSRVERLRGRTTAAAYADKHNAGMVDDHIRRFEELASRGVSTAFVALPDLRQPDDVLALARLTDALA